MDFDDLCETWRHDPLKMQAMLWPNVRFYNKQREMIQSVVDNKETIVPAGNMLGKDFVAGFICLWFFVVFEFSRIVTTSVKDDHLDILWGEINKFILTSELPLDSKKGGPLVLKHHEITKCYGSAEAVKQSYLKGQVSKQGEGLSGHHAEYTLLVVDEASGVGQQVYDHGMEWAKKALIFGNPNPCNNFFFKSVKEGDVKYRGSDKYVKKIIRIRAEDSPSVRWGLAELRQGLQPTNKQIIPGVLTYDEYQLRRDTWDPIMQSIKLDAAFYEGEEVKLFPPAWLNGAETFAATLPSERPGAAMGVDTAEGGDSTVWAIVDEIGLIELVSMKTPNTAVIKGTTKALMKKYDIPAEKVMFDQGGGGQEHADYLREDGVKVRTISFGESVSPDPTRYLKPWEVKQHERRERYAFKNRRAQMYWLAHQKLKPKPPKQGAEPVSMFGLPVRYTALREQLEPLPLTYDEEGRIYLLPKRKKPNSVNRAGTVQSLEELIGHSPDEADAFVMANYVMSEVKTKIKIKPL